MTEPTGAAADAAAAANSGGEPTGDHPGGGGGQDFLQSLPEQHRADPLFQNFSGPDGLNKLLNSYREQRRTISSRSMADMEPPGDEQGRKAVLQKLGVVAPETPDGYDLGDEAKDRAALYHRAGLTKAQAKALAEAEASAASEAETQRQTRIDQRKSDAAEALRREWGEAFEANMDLAKRAYEHFLPDEERQILDVTGLAAMPGLTRFLASAGRALKEGTMHTGTGAGAGPADKAGFRAERVKVEQQMAELQKSETFDPISSGYQQLVKQRNDLLAQEAKAHVAEQQRSP